MGIAQTLKQALQADIQAYEHYYDQLGQDMHPHRAMDLSQLKQTIEQVETASALRPAVIQLCRDMRRVTLFEQVFGLCCCRLTTSIEKTLSRDVFQLAAILAAEVGELTRLNAAYQTQLDTIGTWQAGLSSSELNTLNTRLARLDQLEKRQQALEEENHYLSCQLRDREAEVSRLRQALQLEKEAVKQAESKLLAQSVPAGCHVQGHDEGDWSFSETSFALFASTPTSSPQARRVLHQ